MFHAYNYTYIRPGKLEAFEISCVYNYMCLLSKVLTGPASSVYCYLFKKTLLRGVYPELLTDLVHYYLQPDFRLDAVVKITQNFQITVNLTGLLINPLTGEFTCVH